jgi:uncharacterized protein DUF6544
MTRAPAKNVIFVPHDAKKTPVIPISEADLRSLPDPVVRYLRRCGVIGKVPIGRVLLRQRGRFRMSSDGAWARLRAEQCYTVRPPSFRWRATISPMPFVPVKVVDAFADGQGGLEAKLFGLFTVAQARGQQTDHSELLRFLAEMVWFPTAFVSDYVTWRSSGDRCADATITWGKTSASATFWFDDDDRVIRVDAMRYRIVAGGYALDSWSTPLRGHRLIDGLLVPLQGRALWKLPTGDFEYFDGEITELAYQPSIS